MAVCKVIKKTEGWNVGDTVEAFGDRVNELVNEGIVQVVVPDEVKEVKGKKSKKKG
jgi:hypothetical protein